jgi:hypothetical protein
MGLTRLITRSAAWLRQLGRAPAAVAAPPAPAAQPGGWQGVVGGRDAADPEAVVRAFIADYAAWNDRAWADAAEGSAAEGRQVDEAYREAVGPHLAPGVAPLPAAFDGDALHAPDREAVIDVRVEGGVAQVRTRTAARRAGGPAHRDTVFEYRLRQLGARWAIEAVDRLEPDGGRLATL